MLVAPAPAFELFGTCLFGECKSSQNDDLELIDPINYSVEFKVSPSDNKETAKAVESASELWRGRNSAVAGSAGLVTRAKGDYRRILAALYDEGHYGGTISITVNGREAADIEPGAVLIQPSSVSVNIETGAFYRFGAAEIMNAAPEPKSPRDGVDDPQDQGFVAGAVAKARTIRKAASLAREAWRQQGYPHAKVGEQQITADHPAQRLNARLHMEPGPHAVYGAISVEGAERMDPGFVAEQTRLEPGSEYDPDDIDKAKKRLERLGVFSLQKIREADDVDADGSLPLTVLLEEKPLRRIGAGVTASSIDGLGVEAFWLHRNLFGKAERLRISGAVSGLGTTVDYQKLDYSLDATFTKPGFVNPDTDLVLNAFAKREFNDTYKETSGGGSASLNYLYSDELTLSGGVFAEYGEFTDAFGKRNFITTGLVAGATFDSRDDKLEPTGGLFINLEGKPFYEWEFGNSGVRIEAEGRGYYAVDKDGSIVLAGRVKAGSLFGPPISQTPENLLFLAGGGGSVRGYAFKSIGVPGPGGMTVGGLSLFEVSGEVRARVTEDFGAVAFVDAGTVSADSVVDFSQDMKVGVGAGIRYYTGIGAIRLDVAVPVNPGPNDPDFGVYAGIGQAF